MGPEMKPMILVKTHKRGVRRTTESASGAGALEGGLPRIGMAVERDNTWQAGRGWLVHRISYGHAPQSLPGIPVLASFHCSSEITSGSSATSSVCLDSKSITLTLPKSRTPAFVVRYRRLVSKHAPAVKGPMRTSGVKVKTVFSPVAS